jgi:SAM-dependent methyltransferase/methyltransferase-like protein
MTAYDSVRYPSLPFQQTHPARLAGVARLFGVAAASPARCRVLELGCGDGDNLLPMAAAYPASEFVGLDLAPTAVEKGRRTAEALGLRNVELRAADIREAGDGLGEFDYVVAHGVFSWVPDDVRDALLGLCRRVLSPTGVAYVSYNALPGCHVRRVFWDVMRFHTHGITDDPPLKMRQARAVLHFLAEGISPKSPLGEYMKQEARHVARERHEAVLFHDDLADVNTPFYFHEFAARAAGHGLQFLAEADLSDMEDGGFPPEVAARLADLAAVSVVHQEQYRDFLQMRRFRQTLLVRDDVTVERPAAAGRVPGLAVAFETRPDGGAEADLSPGAAVRFRGQSGAAVTVDHPFAKAALAALARAWPHPLPFETVLTRAAALLGGGPSADDRRVAAEVLLAGLTAGVLLGFVDPPATAADPGVFPRLSAFARHQLDAGGVVLTNGLHLPVKIDDAVTRRLLWLMDGTRDRQAVVADLVRWAEGEAGDAAFDAASVWAHFTREIDAGFAKAAELALLVPHATPTAGPTM